MGFQLSLRALLHKIFKKLDSFKGEILPILAINQKTLWWVESIIKTVMEFLTLEIILATEKSSKTACFRKR